ncbi:MAG: hypothetical protein ABSD38_30810 [Syntrophorhabdales bacterium]|jgi:hypothetical protein
MIPAIAWNPCLAPPAAVFATKREPGPGASTTATEARENPTQSIFIIVT